ncbi:MAG: 2-hydroxyacyl-CoA dehydratase [Deltaproteobacteria bacterium]|nr:2-hydroxyacyl-CoA dehydratase [Deltaproteobacteria bacterium]MBI3075494.1 2-hydroxyacyl-CoA dehydratase [Deltaproteobacteria bacterium]
MAIEAILEQCRALVEDPSSFEAVDRWKAAHPGGRAVGCFPVYSPAELVHAAGMLPVGVFGGGNEIEIAHADSRFQSFICSIIKSTLELGLTGRMKILDGMLFQNICDPARNLASIFKRNFPDMFIEYLHLPQNLGSPRGIEYLAAEYRRVLRALEGWTGQPITDAALRASIGWYNRTRALVRALYQVRAEAPQLLSTVELYTLSRAGVLVGPEAHAQLLEGALATVWDRVVKPKDRLRVVLEGSFCEQPPLGLIEGIEEAGCYILDDDFLLGWRWFSQDVEVDGDPVAALARGYADRSVYSAVKHDLREPKAKHLLDKVRTLKADAVIILAPKFCEPALFDYPLYRKALEEAGILHLFLEFEEKMWIFDRARTEVETFVESMLFD